MNLDHKYLIIGNGRLAKHLAYYFNLLEVKLLSWSRSENNLEELELISQNATHIFICIKDSAIEEFSKLDIFTNKIKIHFSGCLSIPNCHSIHPLMTFSNELYENKLYPKIPLVMNEDAPDLSSLIPEFKNPVYRISEDLRPLYHALCVSGGNFTTMLWQEVFKESLKKLNLPKDAYAEFMKMTVANVLKSPDTALTGPFSRSDFETINKNKQSLKESDLLLIYEAFETAYEGRK